MIPINLVPIDTELSGLSYVCKHPAQRLTQSRKIGSVGQCGEPCGGTIRMKESKDDDYEERSIREYE